MAAIQVPFQNRYLHRTAAKDGQCFICGKFSSAVLTCRDLDWFFVCLNHLKDTSFCKPIIPPQPLPVPITTTPQPQISGDASKKMIKSGDDDKSASDGNIKAEESGKKEAGKEEGKDASTKDDKSEATKKAENSSKKETSKAAAKVPAPAPAPPVIKEYILDSKIFYLRESQYRKKMQARNARQAAGGMPSVPRTSLPN